MPGENKSLFSSQTHSRLLATIFLSLLFSSTLTKPYQIEDHVIVLDESNFEQAIKEHDYLMVEFYAPWCGHCKKLAPEYSEAARILKLSDKPAYFAKVDATKNTALKKQHGVTGYPTLKFFIKGKELEKYKGGRTSSDLVDYVQNQMGSKLLSIKSQESLDKAISKDLSVIVYAGPKKKKKILETLETTAQLHKDMLFFHSESKLKDSKVPFGKISMLRSFNPEVLTFEGKITSDNLASFIQKNRYPALMHFNSEAAENRIFFAKEKKNFVVLFTRIDKKESVKEFEKVAKAHGEEIPFIYCYLDEKTCKKLMSFVKVSKKSVLPQVWIVDQQEKSAKKYKMNTDEKVTSESVKKFYESFKQGTAQREYKKGPIPSDSERYGMVRVVSHDTFEEDVIQSPTYDMVMFQAPWCPHCKKLKPVWYDLALRTTQMGNVRFSMIDGTKNEVAGVEVSGYPSIYFFKKGDKKNPVQYNGGRDADSFGKFLKENLAGEWKDELFRWPTSFESYDWIF